MKKQLLIAMFSSVSMFTLAQEETKKIKESQQYNHWSVEINAGQNKPVRPFSSGYYSSKPNTYFYFNGIEHYDLGVRYMFSNSFGLKLDFGYDEIKSQNGSESLEFNNRQYRIGFQGVANLGRIMRFESFTNRLGLLAHAGIQVSRHQPQMGINDGVSEDNGGIILGFTPQYRITKWLAFTGDFTVINNVRQHFNWDGTNSAEENNLSGLIYNTSLGLTFYLGKKEKHADWYVPTNQLDEATAKRLEDIEKLLNDTDKDGVPDYIDTDNNTVSGVAVDSRGRAIDTNKNGIPDDKEVKNSNNETNINQYNSENNNLSGIDALKSLVENGSVNVFYDLNEDFPNIGSTNNVYMIVQYLKKYPNSKIKLTGYADVRGLETSNQDLSQRRAMKLRNLFTSSGIDKDRITIAAEGVDKSYPTDTKIGLDLARRVSVQLIK